MGFEFALISRVEAGNCAHRGSTRTEGNKVICCRCGKVIGFINDDK